MTVVDFRYREPDTLPHGLPAIPATGGVVDLYTGDADADDEAALEAAYLVRRIARQKGLPRPFRTEPFPGRVVLTLLWPHLPQWVEMLDGLGCAEERGEHLRQTGGRFYVDAEGREWMTETKVTVLPHHQRGDVSIHGWIDVDDGDGGTRHQPFVLTPITDPGCRGCVDLPDTHRQPLSPTAWRDDTWWRLVGRRWSEKTGPRADQVAAARRPSPRRRTAAQ